MCTNTCISSASICKHRPWRIRSPPSPTSRWSSPWPRTSDWSRYSARRPSSWWSGERSRPTTLASRTTRRHSGRSDHSQSAHLVEKDETQAMPRPKHTVKCLVRIRMELNWTVRIFKNSNKVDFEAVLYRQRMLDFLFLHCNLSFGIYQTNKYQTRRFQENMFIFNSALVVCSEYYLALCCFPHSSGRWQTVRSRATPGTRQGRPSPRSTCLCHSRTHGCSTRTLKDRIINVIKLQLP